MEGPELDVLIAKAGVLLSLVNLYNVSGVNFPVSPQVTEPLRAWVETASAMPFEDTTEGDYLATTEKGRDLLANMYDLWFVAGDAHELLSELKQHLGAPK